MKKLLKRFREILSKNQREVEGCRFTVPSSKIYPFQWFWDSCFHSIIYLCLGEIEWAKEEILSILSGQWENGMIPHMIYRGSSRKHRLDWGTGKNTSSITQPPMIAYAVERIYRKANDKNFVEKVFKQLDKYYSWLRTARGDKYLLYIKHPWESGQDDLPVWDHVYGKEDPSRKTLKSYKIRILRGSLHFKVKSVLFNSVYLRNLRSMSFLASAIGLSEKAFAYDQIYKLTEEEFRENLLDPETGIFFALHENKHIKIKTANIFLPLFTKMLKIEEAEQLIEKYLLNEDLFWTKYPVPTVSIDEYAFQPNRYWRGSTWININWFIYKGLKEYHLNDIAEELRQRSISLISKSGFHEYYNSINGMGRGPDDFVWSGLIFDMN